MSVLVTVGVGGRSVDLELDDERALAELLPEIGSALGVTVPVGLTTPEGVRLDPGTTLAFAGVLDGQRLGLVVAPQDATSAATTEVVLPCYVAVDTSDSMAGESLSVVNAELARFVDALRGDPRVTPACRVAVLTFDLEAQVVTPLMPVADLARAPRLGATRPGTNYEAAFRLLRRQIGRDLDGLRMAGLRPLRPLIVLLTDGRPTRGYWPPAHAALTEPGWAGAADILAFGFGEASELAVRRIGVAGAFLPAGTSSAPAGMLATAMSYVLDVLGSAGTRTPVAAITPPGWRSLDEVIT